MKQKLHFLCFLYAKLLFLDTDTDTHTKKKFFNSNMNLTINDEKRNLCESLFGLLLPSFYASIQLDGFNGFYDFLSKLNHTVTVNSSQNNNNNNNTLNGTSSLTNNNININDRMMLSSCVTNNSNCNLMYNYTLDLANYFNFCNQIESNLVYFDWLLNLFKPLIYALCSLFLLPAIVVILLYASSLFCFLSKHWNKLKVSSYGWREIWLIIIYIFFKF